MLLRTLMGGICGTDLAILQHRQPPNSILQAFSSMPMILGHENLAVVEEAGPAVDKGWLGRRVCVDPTLACQARGIEPPCRPCSRGEFGACENFAAAGEGKYRLPAGTSIGYNAATGGSLGEYFVAHHSQLTAVPESVSDELAILTDPLACSLHAVGRADLSRASKVLVYGAGVMGLGIIACLRAAGFGGTVDAIDRAEQCRQMALALGADHVPSLPSASQDRGRAIAQRTGAKFCPVRLGNYMLCGGYDLIFDCVGTAQSVQESLKWTAARGQVILVATGHGGNVDLTPIWFRELGVLGVYGRQIETFQGRRATSYQFVLDLMAGGKLDVARMLTHKFRIEQYRQAFETAMAKSRHRAVKVAIDFR